MLIATELYSTFWRLETEKNVYFKVGDLVGDFTKKLVTRMNSASFNRFLLKTHVGLHAELCGSECGKCKKGVLIETLVSICRVIPISIRLHNSALFVKHCGM